MDREAWNKRNKQHYKREDFVPKEGDPVTVSGACASGRDRRRDVWAYNTESRELVQINPHPTPNPELDSEELARDHLVKNYTHVVYFFVEDLAPDLFPTEV